MTGYYFYIFIVLVAILSYRIGRRHGREENVWEYGVAGKDHSVSRRHRTEGNVQFLLWKPGEQGHARGHWHNYDSSWWRTFISTEEPKK